MSTPLSKFDEAAKKGRIFVWISVRSYKKWDEKVLVFHGKPIKKASAPACSNDKRGLLLLNFFQYGYLYFHLSAVES